MYKKLFSLLLPAVMFSACSSGINTTADEIPKYIESEKYIPEDKVDMKIPVIKKQEKKNLVVTAGDIEIIYEDQSAEEVYLTGDFNNWSRSGTAMTKNKAGEFVTKINLEKGEYLYKFIVDGEWIEDPNNANIHSDGYGGENSVLIVK